MKRFLFKVARSRYAAYFIGFAFERLTPLMPLDKLYSDRYVIIFCHPVPFWKRHWLAVPKRRIPSFSTLNLQELQDQTIVIAIFQAIQQVVSQQSLTEYTVLVNGGAYQDVPQLHFHLASGASKNGESWPHEHYTIPRSAIEGYQNAIAYTHPTPRREVDIIITTVEKTSSLANLDLRQRLDQIVLLDSLILAQKLVLKYGLTEYTLLTNSMTNFSTSKFTLHLVSGSKV